MTTPSRSNLARPQAWRNPASWLYGLGAVLVAVALGILATQSRSSALACSLEGGDCILLRNSLFGTRTSGFKWAEVSRLDVWQVRRRSSLVFVTPSEAIAFAHDTANPPVRDIARHFDEFRKGQAGPRFSVRHDQLPEALPHAAVYLAIGLMLLAGGWLQTWLARKSVGR